MAPHSSTLAWKIPWTEEPGGLQSMGSLLTRFLLRYITFLYCYYSYFCYNYLLIFIKKSFEAFVTWLPSNQTGIIISMRIWELGLEIYSWLL